MNPVERIRSLDPATYRAHGLHGLGRDWPETNCYVDLWIGILSALELEVEASLGFLVASDFEGDQWTFFKPPHGDLDAFYGIRVEELTLWRPLIEHVETQVARGRLPLVEVDSFYLPDTSGTDYGHEHTKTTIAVTSIDCDARRLVYFHNRGLHALEGADFVGVLQPPQAEGRLPPYCEIAKLDTVVAQSDAELRSMARQALRRYLRRRPRRNPIEAYAEAFPAHIEQAVEAGLDVYHAYSFASIRQLGANAELLASYAHWLDRGEGGQGAAAEEAFVEVSGAAKALILKGARMVARGRPRDVSDSFAPMASAWERGMRALETWAA